MFAMKEIQPTAAQAARRALELQSKKVAQLRREADEAGTPGYRLSVMRDDLGKRRAQMAAAGSRAEEIAAALGDEEQKIARFAASNDKAFQRSQEVHQRLAVEVALERSLRWEAGYADLVEHGAAYTDVCELFLAGYVDLAARCVALDQLGAPGRPPVSAGMLSRLGMPAPMNVPQLAKVREPHELGIRIAERAAELAAEFGQ